MIDAAFYTHIANNVTLPTGWTFVFGNAQGVTPPYLVMLKISDPERPDTMCEQQGDQGSALFQFSGWDGGSSGGAASSSYMQVLLDSVKSQVGQIIGVIGSPPDDYSIWYNQTGGVIPLNDGLPEANSVGSIFETSIRWTKL